MKTHLDIAVVLHRHRLDPRESERLQAPGLTGVGLHIFKANELV